MAKFEPKNYPEFNEMLSQAFLTMYLTGQEMYRFPTLMSAIVVADYDLDQDDDNVNKVFTYMETFCAKFFADMCKVPIGDEISWKGSKQLKHLIWRECFNSVANNDSNTAAIKLVCNKVLKKCKETDKAILLGVYITQCIDLITKPRLDMQLDFLMYAHDDLLYRGKLSDDGKWWYSSNNEGIADGDRVTNYFLPGTTYIMSEAYDDTKWDDLTDEEKDYYLYLYNVPAHLIAYIPEVWRGRPIYAGDVIKVTFTNKNGETETALGVYIEESEDISLKWLCPLGVSYTDKQLELAHCVVIGNICDNKEFAEMYETVLTYELFNN